MADMLNISGCETITNKIRENLQSFVASAMANDYGRAKKLAGQIAYDSENLKSFIPDDTCPIWLKDAIIKCREFSKLGSLSSGDFSKYAMGVQEILFQVRAFRWNQWSSQYDCTDLDKEFAQEAAARHLDSAIDRLIECLNVISHDPEFNLSRQTVIDIQTLVSNLKQSKNASQSAIRSWLYTAGELIKLFIPQIDKIEKGIELIKKSEAAFNEACDIIDASSHSVAFRLKNKFCCGEQVIPLCEETPRLSLPCDLEDGDKQ